ncbi:MAG: apolipoprotein N-acyltransferase [Leptothrix sp. (in: b-proteobacteria)]
MTRRSARPATDSGWGRRLGSWLLAALLGAAQALALAPQAHGGWQITAMALFIMLLASVPGVDRFAVSAAESASAARSRPTARPQRGDAWMLAWLFATGWLAATFWWLFISLHRYGEMPAALAGGAVLALALALALYYALAAWCWWRWRSGLIARDALLWSMLWLLAELARAQWFTGFPWGAIGYAQVDGPLVVLAPWVGVYGVGAVSAFAAAVLGGSVVRLMGSGPRHLARWPAWLGLVAALPVLVAPAWLGPDFTQRTSSLQVALLQGNVPQEQKFDALHQNEALEWHVQALLKARADLVVAPETAIALLPDQLPRGLWAQLEAHFARGQQHALIGRPLGSYDEGYTNSVSGLGSDRPAYRYDKHHLVPFGEFIPTGFRWFVDWMRMPLGDFTRGPLAPPSFAVGTERVGPNICYEDLFGEELATRFIDPLQAPTLMVNVSNIGWFGDSIAVAQHLQISRFRALELQRPMLRATNTGATAVIDHRGVVRAALPPHQRGVLEAQVDGRQGVTPFARWAGRWGLWPLWIGAVLLVTLARRPRRAMRLI